MVLLVQDHALFARGSGFQLKSFRARRSHQDRYQKNNAQFSTRLAPLCVDFTLNFGVEKTSSALKIVAARKKSLIESEAGPGRDGR